LAQRLEVPEEAIDGRVRSLSAEIDRAQKLHGQVHTDAERDFHSDMIRSLEKERDEVIKRNLLHIENPQGGRPAGSVPEVPPAPPTPPAQAPAAFPGAPAASRPVSGPEAVRAMGAAPATPAGIPAPAIPHGLPEVPSEVMASHGVQVLTQHMLNAHARGDMQTLAGLSAERDALISRLTMRERPPAQVAPLEGWPTLEESMRGLPPVGSTFPQTMPSRAPVSGPAAVRAMGVQEAGASPPVTGPEAVKAMGAGNQASALQHAAALGRQAMGRSLTEKEIDLLVGGRALPEGVSRQEYAEAQAANPIMRMQLGVQAASSPYEPQWSAYSKPGPGRPTKVLQQARAELGDNADRETFLKWMADYTSKEREAGRAAALKRIEAEKAARKPGEEE
jgi:hypothetical protein